MVDSDLLKDILKDILKDLLKDILAHGAAVEVSRVPVTVHDGKLWELSGKFEGRETD